MAGGIAGVTVQQSMRFGVARGLFSNEAGLGSTPHAHALAKVERPQDQGAVAILGVFVDTFVVLTLTGLVLITSGLIPQGMTGTVLTQAAFSQAFGGFGSDLHRGVHVLFRVFVRSSAGISSASRTSRRCSAKSCCRCTASL